MNPDLYLAYKNVPVNKLEVKSHFLDLTTKEQFYAHHISRACWFGTRITLQQVSSESLDFYLLILELFKDSKDEEDIKKTLLKFSNNSGLSKEVVDDFFSFVAQFLGNLGNYKSFGDTKFIPRITFEEFKKIIFASGSSKALLLFDKVGKKLYSLNEKELMLGYPGPHISSYYSDDMTQPEIELVQKYLEFKNINAYNTRVWKVASSSYQVRIASCVQKVSEPEQFNNSSIQLCFGDYSEQMCQIVNELKQAIPYSANDTEKNMLEKYIESFETGSIEAHKASQRYWIKDIGPKVESNLGFIESYRDPAGVRGEWEGFCACVNLDQTKKFEVLVSNAKKFISKLPWGAKFEKDKFHKPDFTSLEVLAYCASGIPAGINIPNYDDIRMNDGFKNVSLGNILNSPTSSSEKITFLGESDLALYEKYKGPAFEVQVGIHELLGHGSGKLFEESSKGVFNFDPKNPPINPLTGNPINSWYKPGETFGSKFGSFASSYEECRAESCGIFLSVEEELLKIFGHENEEAQKVFYVNWLLMVRAGLLALEFYDPVEKKWGQAHMRARFAILRVLLEAGQGLVEIKYLEKEQDLLIVLNKNLILSVGIPAMSKFLVELQVYKATADEPSAKYLYEKYSSMDMSIYDWDKLRDIVLSKRQPRKVFVQPNTFIINDKIHFKEYEDSSSGLIMSFVDRKV